MYVRMQGPGSLTPTPASHLPPNVQGSAQGPESSPPPLLPAPEQPRMVMSPLLGHGLESYLTLCSLAIHIFHTDQVGLIVARGGGGGLALT